MKVFKEIRLNLLYLGAFFPEEEAFVVKSIAEGIETAKEKFQKHRFYGFYFTEHEYIIYKGKRYRPEKCKSKPIVYHLIAKKVFTHDDIAKMDEPTLLFNMEANGYKYIVQTVMGNYQPYLNDGGTVLYDDDFKLLKLTD